MVEDVFSLLSKPIRRIIEDKWYANPTSPQIQAIPPILAGKNVLLIAPTGTGKTEAAFLPIFSILTAKVAKTKGIKILYITPLRSLNRDILRRLGWWCNTLDIKVAVRHGDTETKERFFQSRSPPDVLITTPETLQAVLPGKRMQKHLSTVRWIIIDEIHEFAEDKRGTQLSLALERLRLIAHSEFQIIGISATIGSPEKVAHFLVGNKRSVMIVRSPLSRRMELNVIYPTLSKEDESLATQLYVNPEIAVHLRIIRNLIEEHKSVLLFTNTRSIAEILASRFKIWDVTFPVSIHHSSIAKSSRVAAETGLKEGDLLGLICTSSLELGIDVGKIDLCIQYMSPRQVTRLVQRVGRSGHSIDRAAKGLIITMDSDDALEAMVIARRACIENLEPVLIPEKPLDVLVHEIVGLLMQSRRWNFSRMLEVFNNSYPYRELKEEELVNVLKYMHYSTPRLAWVSFEDKIVMRPKNIKDIYKFYYENLSMIPDMKNYLIFDKTTDTQIGILSGAFVAEYGVLGTKFIIRGSPWKIVNVHEDKVYVKPIEDPTGAIPSWVGDMIPVSFNVAKEVGEIRCFVERKLEQKISLEKIATELIERYPVNKESVIHAIMEVFKQFNKAFPIPTAEKIVIEKCRDYIILHGCFGSLANRTLATLIGHILSEKTGYSIGVQEDPFRVILNSENIYVEMVYDVLHELSSMDINALAVHIFQSTGLFKRRMIDVSRRFGAISKQVDLNSINLHQLLKTFQGTAVFDEAIKELLTKDLNIPDVVLILEGIRNNKIEVITLETKEPTPIARIGLEKTYRLSFPAPETTF